MRVYIVSVGNCCTGCNQIRHSSECALLRRSSLVRSNPTASAAAITVTFSHRSAHEQRRDAKCRPFHAYPRSTCYERAFSVSAADLV
jgi:hypothetical protein